MKKLLIPLPVLLILIIPAISHAATWEYITYGGYDACLSAWRKVALIFSDNAYNGLFITAIVIGALFAFASAYVRIATGAKGGIHSWFVYMLLGAMLYAAFIVPKDELVIYDQTLNRGPETVSDVPRGIATLAGLLNKIEVGFTDIVSTSADPASDYRTNAGGTGFMLLDMPPIGSSSLRASLQRYIKDCVFPETTRPGTILSVDKIANGQQTWDIVIAESANPSLYTVYYTENNPAGDTKTCWEAGGMLMQALNSPDLTQKTASAVCNARSFTGVTGNQACSNLINSTVQLIFLTGDMGLYIKQQLFADTLLDVMASTSTTEAIKAMATMKTQSNLIGMAAHANSWIPVIKETMKAVAISLVPFMALIMVTPLAGRAISLIAGMFLWVTVWGVVDAVLHSMAIDLAKQASDSLKVDGNLGMGLVQMMMLPQDYLPKVAATFGAIRWSGLMLSTVMTGMLVRFGGAALGMLAGSITSIPQSSGAQYGSMVQNPGGIMSGEVLPSKTYANAAAMHGGFRGLIEGSSKFQAGQMSGQARTGMSFGAEKIAQATASNTAHSIGAGLGQMEVANKHFSGMDSLQSVAQLGQKEKTGATHYGATVVKGPFAEVAQTRDGKWRVSGVNSGLLSSSITSAQESIKGRAAQLAYEATKSKSITELQSLYNDVKDTLSDSERSAIEADFRKSIDVSHSSGGSTKRENTITKTGTFQAGVSGNLSFKDPILASGSSDGGGLPGKKTSAGSSSYDRGPKIGLSYANQAQETTGSSSTVSDETRQAIARAYAEKFLKGKDHAFSSSRGWEENKMFKDEKSYREASKLADEYRQLESLKSSISYNAMPLIVQQIGDEKYSHLSYDERYDIAMRDVIMAVHRGDVSEYRDMVDKIQVKGMSRPENNVTRTVMDNVKNMETQIEEEAPNNPFAGKKPTGPLQNKGSQSFMLRK